jgi:aspartate ammonia-lyase
LALLLEGRPPLQLGVELQVSRAVVKSTLAALRQKLGADNDVQLGAIAIQRGLDQPQMAAPPITAAVAEVAGEELPAATPRFASGADRQAIEARIQALIQQIGHTRPGLSHRREQLLTELYALRRSLHPAGARS